MPAELVAQMARDPQRNGTQAEKRVLTVLGDAVNLASRIEALTRVHGIDVLASERTRADIGQRLAVVEVDRVRV